MYSSGPAFAGILYTEGNEQQKKAARIAVERRCGRLEWSVLNWNTPAIGFYDSIGAVPLDDWHTRRLTGDALERVAQAQ